jgi:hypothetical protein
MGQMRHLKAKFPLWSGEWNSELVACDGKAGKGIYLISGKLKTARRRLASTSRCVKCNSSLSVSASMLAGASSFKTPALPR